MTRFHHVANGTSVTSTIVAAGIPGTWSIWADPLYEGPVPGGVSDAELMDVRRQFLGGGKIDENVDPVIDLRNWRSAIERRECYDELVLWFEHDLFDQLNLIQLLSWIRERRVSDSPVSLICIGSFPGRPDFHGLGELTTEELAPLLDTRQPVTDDQYALAERAWLAFRSNTPEAIDDLRRTSTSALPFLSAALTRLLQEYPSATGGLSRSERRLLQLADPGPLDLRAAFPRMHEDEHAYYISDTSLAELADDLSSGSAPLVTVTPAQADDPIRLRRSATLTDTGRAVLDGRQDKVAMRGIDRWIGGVHLAGADSPWRWDDRAQRIVAYRTSS
ncbi:MAG TPA: hypothetical protein VH436_27350 [Vicinamibacterales bacterium]|jgi:hypothetical protein